MTVHETLVRDAVDAACRHVLWRVDGRQAADGEVAWS